MASLFTANYIKPILGTANITLIMMMIAATDAFSALAISRVMKQLKHARIIAFVGSLIQFFMFIILILVCHPPDAIQSVDPDTGKTIVTYLVDDAMIRKAWTVGSILAVVCGIADAMVQSGTNTSIGIISAGSVEVRGASFGFSSLMKSTGSIFVFLSTKVLSFRVQMLTIACILVASMGAQMMNIIIHKTIDVDYLQDKYDNFRCISCEKRRKMRKLKEQARKNESDQDQRGTGLQDL